MAICCILGLIAKKIMNPFANIVTEALHIPGGISTGFSIMFLVVAVELLQIKKSGTLMGIMIDVAYYLQGKMKLSCIERMIFANALAAVMASVTANLIVFRLSGPVLLLYLCVSATSGSIYGVLASEIVTRVKIAINDCQLNIRGET